MVVRGDAVSVSHGHQDVREMVGDRYRRDTRSGDQDDRCAEGGKRKRQRQRLHIRTAWLKLSLGASPHMG